MMATITFDEITARVAAFHAEHNSPVAGARRALREVAVLLPDLTPAERAEIYSELIALAAELDGTLISVVARR